ncbi:MAG: 3-methyl-2-oxobutanoate hydroxymethyltransferase [Burkholderiales bacterium]|nr:3-methyl-2-oxobutanoate hydroxymethyltransferase [Phycisphaerae bacterium]
MTAPGKPFTLNDLRTAATTKQRVAMLTCYDFTTATILESAGVPMLLVGDSASNVILGHRSTIPITLDLIMQLTAAVKRGAPRTLVMGDMPFGSYQASDAQGIENVCRMLKETNCDCVKLEAGASLVPMFARLADAGIAAVAHIGLRPQAVGLMGGYRYQGRTAAEARAIVDLAVQFSRAGAAALMLEAVPPEVGQRVVERVNIPVIGCGAGPHCHAHVVVLQDLLRHTSTQPRFVPQPSGSSLIEIARNYVTEISSGTYPQLAHCYQMVDGESRKFLSEQL